ncbi:hypothetical protein K439DRAFT_1612192 [Ramaria rubella]|nr:hypothetical protein K439DRAFT_1612192 [Ramaria rubella]
MSTSHSEVSEISPLARRVITGHDEDGKSKVIYNDNQGHELVMPNGSRLQTLWITDAVPVDCSLATAKDPTLDNTKRLTNIGGSMCIMVSMRPGGSSPMHITKSCDYGVILEGEIVLETENGESTLLKTGDVIVQRQTKHAFHNRHPTKWAKMFCVCIVATEEGAPAGGK